MPLKFFRKNKTFQGMEIEDSVLSYQEGVEDAELEAPFKKRDLSLLWYFMLILALALFSRFFFLNVVRGEHYREVSKGNRIRSLALKAPRGLILDKNGNVLARNIPSLDVILIPRYLPDNFEEREKISETISNILEMNVEDVKEIFSVQAEKTLDPVLIKSNVPQEQALILAEKLKEMPGVMIEKTAIRNYENSLIFAHILGYDGKITREELESNPDYLMTDYIGKSGIEKSYESQLRGKFGAHQVEVDSLGRIKKNIGFISPQPGSDLILNIDEGLQKKVYDSLSAILEKTETETATAVAIDPRSGGILAMVSIPGFDNNLFAKGISGEDYRRIISDKNLPLLNRATNGEYSPGSTLKPAVAIAALSEGVINEKTTINCSGEISVGSWRFGDWKTHGLTDIKKAIAESCNVFFYSTGGGYFNISGLGMEKMKMYNELFGFGSPTGVDLPGEAKGLMPDENWKLEKIGERWYVGDNYHASIGQGFITATPLQLANYTAALANGGILYSPKIVNYIKKPDGEEVFFRPEEIRKNFVDKGAMRTVREGMRQTVVSGSARSLNDLPVEAAGKTGTTQFGSEGKTHAWFISFAPFDNPTIAMAVLVEGGGEGSSFAVPATKEIYQWYFGEKNKKTED